MRKLCINFRRSTDFNITIEITLTDFFSNLVFRKYISFIHLNFHSCIYFLLLVLHHVTVLISGSWVASNYNKNYFKTIYTNIFIRLQRCPLLVLVYLILDFKNPQISSSMSFADQKERKYSSINLFLTDFRSTFLTILLSHIQKEIWLKIKNK